MASAGANDFDDYEEGTFTPTIGDDSLDGTGEGQTYDAQVGSYTKWGNRIAFDVMLIINSLGTLTVNQGARILGLPFTSSAVANSESSIFMGEALSLAITAGTNVTGIINTNAADIALDEWTETTGPSQLLISELSAGATIRISGVYKV